MTAARDTKPTNPKDAIGSDKLPLHLWPPAATALGCLGLLDGALKYGRANWRDAGVRASSYKDALDRHTNAWFEGEELDPDSGLPHLGHALACLAILVDAQASGKLTDDRNYQGDAFRPFVDQLTTHVPRLKEKHTQAGRDPVHYTNGTRTSVPLETPRDALTPAWFACSDCSNSPLCRMMGRRCPAGSVNS